MGPQSATCACTTSAQRAPGPSLMPSTWQSTGEQKVSSLTCATTQVWESPKPLWVPCDSWHVFSMHTHQLYYCQKAMHTLAMLLPQVQCRAQSCKCLTLTCTSILSKVCSSTVLYSLCQCQACTSILSEICLSTVLYSKCLTLA